MGMARVTEGGLLNTPTVQEIPACGPRAPGLEPDGVPGPEEGYEKGYQTMKNIISKFMHDNAWQWD